jgi:hypothetical protein
MAKDDIIFLGPKGRPTDPYTVYNEK